MDVQSGSHSFLIIGQACFLSAKILQDVRLVGESQFLTTVSGKHVLHQQNFLQDIHCVGESYYRYIHGCVIVTCKMTVMLVLMSRSLTIDHRLCSNKDTKEERQYQ